MPFYDLFGVLEFEVDEYIEEESQIRADVEMQAHGPLPPGYLSREEQEMADRAAEVAASVADFSAKLRKKCARTSTSPSPSPFTPDMSCAAAPWCILLDLNFFLLKEPFSWRCADMLSLRATCSGLRGGISSRTYALELLNTMKWTNRPDVADVPLWQLFRLCDAFRAEAEFLRLVSAHGRFRGACCVAGSHALHRLMLLDLGMRPEFSPSDLDVFVSDPDAVPAVVQLSRLFLEALHRLPAGSTIVQIPEGPYGATPPGADPIAGHSFPLAPVLAAMDYFRHAASNALRSPAEWMPAFRRLPPLCGAPKAHQLRKSYRVVQPPRVGALLFHPRRTSFGSFALPHEVNVVLVSFDRPTPAVRVVDGFDMYQCQVAMHAHEETGGFAFSCSEVTRQCALHKQIQLTPSAFGPLDRPFGNDPLDRPHYEFIRVLKETIRRVRKYEKHGFRLVEDGGGAMPEGEAEADA